MAGFNLNQVAISGNLTRDPELRSTGGGTPVCSISVAVNERTKGQDGEWTDRASFFDVTIWKGMGEWVANNLKKGDGIAVAGRLKQDRWEQDGNNRSKVVIVADSIMPRSGEGSGGNGGGGGFSQRTGATDVPAPETTAPVGGGSAAPPDPDDIPFMNDGFASFEERREHSRWF